LRTGLYQPGCSTVAVNLMPRYQAPCSVECGCCAPVVAEWGQTVSAAAPVPRHLILPKSSPGVTILVHYLAGTRFGGPFQARLPIHRRCHEVPAVDLILNIHDADPRREIFSRHPILSVVPEPVSVHSSPAPLRFQSPIYRRRWRPALACCSDPRPERPPVRIPVRRLRSQRPNRFLPP
jgi:hypothetical protein